MTQTDYHQCVMELYRSEVLGEAVFLALLERAQTDEQKYKFATLLQLETETKARLRPLLAKYGLSLVEDDMSAEAAAAANDFERGGWDAFVNGSLNVVRYFVSRFEEIEKIGPAEDAEILRSMVIHERAIESFLDAEKNGKPTGSAKPVEALLRYPLPNARAF